jgi:hypothetical protein
VGRVEIPARKWIFKGSLWCQQLTRGVCKNIGDILVKVRGSGVKVRFWTPFWQGISKSFSLFLPAPLGELSLKILDVLNTKRAYASFVGGC